MQSGKESKPTKKLFFCLSVQLLWMIKSIKINAFVLKWYWHHQFSFFLLNEDLNCRVFKFLFCFFIFLSLPPCPSPIPLHGSYKPKCQQGPDRYIPVAKPWESKTRNNAGSFSSQQGDGSPPTASLDHAHAGCWPPGDRTVHALREASVQISPHNLLRKQWLSRSTEHTCHPGSGHMPWLHTLLGAWRISFKPSQKEKKQSQNSNHAVFDWFSLDLLIYYPRLIRRESWNNWSRGEVRSVFWLSLRHMVPAS